MTNTRTVFRTEWFEVEEEWFDGITSLRGRPHYRITSPDGVIVLAVTPHDEVVLVRQFRPALRRWTLELPSGAVDAGESPADAARRELFEETGYLPADVAELGAGRIMMNRHACRDFGFLATGAVRDAAFQPKEEIDVVLAPAAEFRRLVVSGEFEQLAALGFVLISAWKLGRPLAAR